MFFSRFVRSASLRPARAALAAVAAVASLVQSASAQQASAVRFGHGCPHGTVVCATKNTQYSTDTRQPPAANRIFVRFDVPSDLQLSGFELLLRSVSGTPLWVPTALYAADGNRRPAGILRAGQDVFVDGTQRWVACWFSPIAIAGGTTVFLAYDNPGSIVSLGATSNANGVAANWYRQPLSGGSIVGPLTETWKFRVLCGGHTPNIQFPNNSVPRLGSRMNVHCDDVPSGVAVLHVGLSNTSHAGVLLPLDLTLIGAPQCDLLVGEFLAQLPGTPASGGVDRSFVIPNDPASAGNHWYLQWIVYAPGANAINIVLSNGGDLTLGY